MENALIAPAKYFFLFIPTVVFSILIPIAGIAVFSYIMAIRMAPLVKRHRIADWTAFPNVSSMC